MLDFTIYLRRFGYNLNFNKRYETDYNYNGH